MGEKKTTDNSMSLSKQRKVARKKEIEQMKRNKLISKFITFVLAIVIVGGLGSFIGYKIYRNATKVEASSNFSLGLNDNGMIKDVTATDCITLPEYKGITIPKKEVEYTKEKLDEDIQKIVDAKATLNKETKLAIKDKSKVNIDYVGKIDGKEFAGGSTEGKGTDVTVGSNSMIDDFEQQLIGHKIGDKFTIEVTFPNPYENNPDLAGKDASFDITINGIYIAPEFNDAFVKENYSDVAKTAEEYKKYLTEQNYNQNLEAWITNYLKDTAKVTDYPDKYMDNLKSNQKYYDLQMYDSMNSYYMQVAGTPAYKSFEDYTKMSEVKYDNSLYDKVKPMAQLVLAYQAIAEKEGITVTEEEYIEDLKKQGKTEKDFESEAAQYGKAYLLQEMLQNKVLNFIKDNATVK